MVGVERTGPATPSRGPVPSDLPCADPSRRMRVRREITVVCFGPEFVELPSIRVRSFCDGADVHEIS